jgi:hypothetical protein
MSRSLYADHYNGLVTRGAPVDHPGVKSVSPPGNPAIVLIADCGDSTHWLKYVLKTGRLENNTPGGRQKVTAKVEKQPGGAWKVAEFAVEGLGSC